MVMVARSLSNIVLIQICSTFGVKTHFELELKTVKGFSSQSWSNEVSSFHDNSLQSMDLYPSSTALQRNTVHVNTKKEFCFKATVRLELDLNNPEALNWLELKFGMHLNPEPVL